MSVSFNNEIANMLIRQFDLKNEDPEALWALFRVVYGTDVNARTRWAWEIGRHPLRERIRIWVAEEHGKIVGMTVRLPVQLLTAGNKHDAEFATNTMVHPDFRRQGLVQLLYRHAIDSGNLQLSKGTMPAMVRRLDAMGYREIAAAKTYVFLLAPMRWLYQKITGRSLASAKSHEDACPPEYIRVSHFDRATHAEVCCGAVLSVWRDAALLDWRYCAIPHRQYECYIRVFQSEIVSCFVLRFSGTTAFLVDLYWVPEMENLQNLVRNAVRTARRCGAVKMIYWGTLQSVNNEMKRQGGWGRPAEPRFRFFSKDRFWNDFRWEDAHFVQGDGDFDYL
jgi:GNAT superfamily N-acetyltransferase